MDATNYRTVYAALLDEINYRALCAVLNAPPELAAVASAPDRTEGELFASLQDPSTPA